MEKRVVVLAIFVILCFELAYAASTNSSNYNVYLVVPGGGGKSNSSIYNIFSVIGQPIVGKTNTSLYNAWLGFFYGGYYNLNFAPSMPLLFTPPNSSRQIGNLANLTYSSTDKDGNNIIYYVYGDTATSPSTSIYTGEDEYYEWATTDGKLLYWKVLAYDGQSWSPTSKVWNFRENNRTIHNPPIISPANPKTNDNLTCTPSGVFDSDGDTITYAHNWKKDGNYIAVLNMPFDYNTSMKNREVMDYSGSGNNGTVSGATWADKGITGGAYSFYGNDFITVNDANSLDISSAITIELWVNATNTDSGTLISKEGAYDINWSTTLHGIITTGSPNNVSFALPANKWFHVALTYNGNMLRLYINGTERSNASVSGAIATNGNDLIIGSLDGSSKYFSGRMDNVKIYNAALSASQIYLLYNETAENEDFSKIAWSETSVNQIWLCEVTPIDGYENGLTKSDSVLLGNSPPHAPLLDYPVNDSTTTNRTITFNWTEAEDDDGDSLTYNYLIDDNSDFSSPVINQTAINALEFTNPSYLDVSTNYFWKVRAHDGLVFGNYSEVWNFTIDEIISLVLTVANVDFKGLQPDESNDTTDNTPPPLRVQNTGNVDLNITIKANESLFENAGLNTRYFQAKPGVYEIGAYDLGLSPANWVNLSTSDKNLIYLLKWNTSTDEAEIDLRVQVPPGEPPKSGVRAKLNITGTG